MSKTLNDVLVEMVRGKFGGPIDKDWKLRHDSINDEGGLKSQSSGEKYADQSNTFKYDDSVSFHDVPAGEEWRTAGMNMSKHKDGRYYTRGGYDRDRAVAKGFKLSDNQKG